jgi:hypothetical protein
MYVDESILWFHVVLPEKVDRQISIGRYNGEFVDRAKGEMMLRNYVAGHPTSAVVANGSFTIGGLVSKNLLQGKFSANLQVVTQSGTSIGSPVTLLPFLRHFTN